MKNAIRPFIKYPILAHVILVALFLFGYVGFKSLKTTFFPPIPSRTILIQAAYPGASPEEIEEAIVTKIEDNLKGLTGIERVTSVSNENFCSITVRTLTGYDINVVLQDVKNAVNKVSSFPVGMERLTIFRREPMNFAIDFVLAGDTDLLTLKKEARKIERDLLALEGISKVSLSGFPVEEIEISVRENDMRRFELTFDEIINSIRKTNVRMTGGKIKGEKEELLIRANVKGYYAEELRNNVLKSTKNGAIVRLKDVATLKDKWSEDPNRVFYNGERAVRVTINNTNQEDLFQITDLVRKYTAEYNQTNENIQAYVVRDGGEIINERIDILTENGLLGIFLVILFLSLSLNPRISFWVALAIPVSFAGMLMIGPAYGLTINIMSLMAMILILGILVDDGIVIAENIYQHHENGEKPIPAAINGTIEVLPSVVASVLTTVVIFTTFFFLEGGLGDRSKDLAFVVVSTLLISLIEATFILPSHIAHSKAICDANRKKNIIERGAQKVLYWIRDKIYSPVLHFTVHNPLITTSAIIAIFMITLGALRGSIIKTTFFPSIERRSVNVELELPAGTPDSITDSLLLYMEKQILKVGDIYKEEHPDQDDLILSITRRTGPGTHQGSMSVTLISSEKREWTSMQAADRMRKMVGEIEEAEKLTFGGGGHWGKPVSIALASNNLEQLRNAAEALKSELRNVSTLKDVSDNDPPGLREVHLTLKEKTYALGLSTADVVTQVRNGFFGGQSQRILRGIDEVKIWVRYSREDRSSLEKLEKMRIRLQGGRSYPLKQIADFRIERGIMAVNHIDGQRIISVEADVASPRISVPDMLADIEKEIMPGIEKTYPEVRHTFEGERYENEKTMRAISQIVPPILILMFLIIAITFRSFSQAIIVFLLIPFSLIGVLWGHLIQGYIVSMLSWFGAIALAGIVVNDSLVFVSTMNRLLKEGKEFRSSLYEAGLSRFRPVLLTSLTTIAGLGPLIFEKSHQAQFLSPMAISVAYGLLFGTILTLVLLPALLAALNRTKVLIFKVLKRKQLDEAAVEPAVREEIFARESSSKACKEGES